MDFRSEFDAAICVDALEHVFPEDWPGIVNRFYHALKSGGLLYTTVELADPDVVKASYEHAIAMGLPVVPGEIADKIDDAYNQVIALKSKQVPPELAGLAAYHFYPSLEQVRLWFTHAGFVIEEEGEGDGYAHFLVRKES